MKLTEYEDAMGKLGREEREQLLRKARNDSQLPVGDYLKLEDLDQALCGIEDRRENQA